VETGFKMETSDKPKAFEKLVNIMERLRDAESGCPWDLEQTHESLKPYLVEEAYETLEAIDSGQSAKICEELGDVLLQIVFHSRIAEEKGDFDIAAVANGISEKMISRHPHIFGGKKLDTPSEVVDQWEVIKQKEAGGARNSLLDGIPVALPALSKAHRVQERVSRVGFDWSRVEEVLVKVNEEIEELTHAGDSASREEIEHEFGDILFSLVNLSRFIGVDPESSLQKAVSRFTARFRYMERKLNDEGREARELTLDELDRVWEDAKNSGH